MLKNTFLIGSLVLVYSLISWSDPRIKPSSVKNRSAECIIQSLGRDINDTTCLLKDSVYIIANNELSFSYSKVFEVFNTTSKSVYLYSGLFISDWLKQPYVHQYDKYKHAYIFSLTPLYKNFKNIFQYNLVLDVHYNWYSFVELKPNQYYRFRTSIGERYFEKEQNAIKSIHPQAAYEALKSPFLTLKNQNIQSAIIRVGVYSDVTDLCEDKAFNQDELTGLQMRFTTISTDFNFWGTSK